MEKCLKEVHNINEQICIWECEWKLWKNVDMDTLDPKSPMFIIVKKVQLFFSKYADDFALRPKMRLIPRESVRGGLVETYALAWTCTKSEPPVSTIQKSELFYLDVNSLYPATNFCPSNLYPSGPANYIVNPRELKEIIFVKGKDNVVTFKGNQIWGLIQASFVPPKSLEHPFLIEKIKQKGNASNGQSSSIKNIVHLCHTCASKNCFGHCRHSKRERAITGVYTIDEAAYAVSIGYEILQIYEVLYYTQRSPLFKKFLSLLACQKIKYSGFPSAVTDPIAKQAYCDKINSQLTPSHPLEISDFEFNPSMRYLAKISSNALLGKIGQNSDKTVTVYISSQQDLNNALTRTDYDITSAITIVEGVTQVQMRPSVPYRRINRRTNVVAAAHTTAWARILMHQHLMTLQRSGCTLYYMDTGTHFLHNLLFTELVHNYCCTFLSSLYRFIHLQQARLHSHAFTLGRSSLWMVQR